MRGVAVGSGRPVRTVVGVPRVDRAVRAGQAARGAAAAKYLGQRAYNTHRRKEAYGEKLPWGNQGRGG